VFKPVVLFCLIVFTSIACNTSAPNPEDVVAVRKVLAQRAEAIRSKDMESYKAVFMPDYFDGKYKYQDIIDEMTQAFATYESIDFTAQRAPVEVKMNSARVVQRIEYELKGREKPAREREILLLRRIEGEWKISGGVVLGLLQP